MKSRKLTFKDHLTEFTVAGFFLAAVAVLIYYTMILSQDTFNNDSYRLNVKFEEVANLERGNKVLFRGMEVGAVKGLSLVDDGVIVQVAIRDGVKIFTDCVVKIESSSMLGGNLVSIKQGVAKDSIVSAGDTIIGKVSNGLMSEASSVLEELKADGTFEDFAATMKNFKKISDKISEGEGTLGKLINDDDFYDEAKTLVAELKKAGNSVSKAGDDISVLVGDAQKVIDDLKKDITDTVANVKEFSESLNNKESSIAKLFSDDGGLFKKLEDSMADLKDITAKLNSTEGTLGKLINDPAVFEEAKATFAEVKDTFNEVKGAVQDYRESSTISTFGSLIFGAM